MVGNTLFDTILPDKLKVSISIKAFENFDIMNFKQRICTALKNHFPDNAFEVKLTKTTLYFWITPTRYRTSPSDNKHTDTNLIPPTEEELYNLFIEMGLVELTAQNEDSIVVNWLDITKNTLVSKPVSAYIKLLKNRLYKGFLEVIDDSSSAKNTSIVISALKKDCTEKDITGTRKYIFYDKMQQLKDKSSLRSVELRRPLTNKEIQMLPVGSCNETGTFIDFRGIYILRTELQFKQNNKLQYVSQFLTGNKSDTKLKFSTILELLEKRELYAKLDEYFTYTVKTNIFYDNPNNNTRLTSYDRLLLRLIKNQSKTSLLIMYEFDEKLHNLAKAVLFKIQSAEASANELYKELYLKLGLGESD